MKVVYGHTDSIYVKIDSIEKAKEAAIEINDHVRESFPNLLNLPEHPVVLEFEKYYSSLGVGSTKNRNAGLISWKDGYDLDEPEFVMTGFTAKRISETPLAKDVQMTVLRKWLNGESRKQINSWLHSKYNSIINGDFSLLDIIKRSRLKENRFNLKCPSCGRKYTVQDCYSIEYCSKCGKTKEKFVTVDGKRPIFGEGIAGILYGREKLDMEYDDSYLFVKVKSNDTYTHPLTDEQKQVEYFSATTYDDFKNVKPNLEHYAKVVMKKAEPVYKAMGWELDSIRTGSTQSTFEDWW
jgi:DNA polymerase elongation subunit (family B)